MLNVHLIAAARPNFMKIAPLYHVLARSSLVCDAAAVMTDSGGVQEETTFLGIPCLTLRENTERPVTVNQGFNRLVNAMTVVGALNQDHGLPRAVDRRPALWNGVTAERCAADLRRRFLKDGE